MRSFIVHLVCGLSFATVSAQPSRSEEPDYKTVNSGHCEVKVCTDFDFGDHVFRMYSAKRASTLHVIPPGACICKAVRKAGRDFNNDLHFGIRTPEGRF